MMCYECIPNYRRWVNTYDARWVARAKSRWMIHCSQDTAPAVLTALGASWPWHTVTDVQVCGGWLCHWLLELVILNVGI
jgi:hypothetical protein